jgi:hypothetical protein
MRLRSSLLRLFLLGCFSLASLRPFASTDLSPASGDYRHGPTGDALLKGRQVLTRLSCCSVRSLVADPASANRSNTRPTVAATSSCTYKLRFPTE